MIELIQSDPISCPQNVSQSIYQHYVRLDLAKTLLLRFRQ